MKVIIFQIYIYIFYLVNLYFCVEQTIEYITSFKVKYKDIELIDDIERNIEKKWKYDKPNTFNKIKAILKSENTLSQNEYLNEQMKKYVDNNDCDKFLDDLKNIIKLKDNIFVLSQPDPQNLPTKAFLCSKGIPLKFPDSLKIK